MITKKEFMEMWEARTDNGRLKLMEVSTRPKKVLKIKDNKLVITFEDELDDVCSFDFMMSIKSTRK